MAYARISITLPKALLVAADRRAKELDRPRSWLLAEALRSYLNRGAAGTAREGPGGATARVREPTPAPDGAAAVAEARQHHLAADLRLTPEERLRRAEDLGRLARAGQGSRVRHQIIGFDSYEDFYEWKKARRVGG